MSTFIYILLLPLLLLFSNAAISNNSDDVIVLENIVVDENISCTDLGKNEMHVIGKVVIAGGSQSIIKVECPIINFFENSYIHYMSHLDVRATSLLLGQAAFISKVKTPINAETQDNKKYTQAASGKRGSKGTVGQPARGCFLKKNRITVRSGGDGEDGSRGKDGRKGQDGIRGENGTRGKSLHLYVMDISDQSEIIIESVGSNGTNGSNGQDGQNGGDGGHGGHGGAGGYGKKCVNSGDGGQGGNGGNGGDGGDGGRGGDGGHGGNGGDVQLYLSESAARKRVLIEVNNVGGKQGLPGKGGKGGNGGRFGDGGLGGEAGGKYLTNSKFRTGNDGIRGENGSVGKSGSHGKNGYSGRHGKLGIYAKIILSDEELSNGMANMFPTVSSSIFH